MLESRETNCALDRVLSLERVAFYFRQVTFLILQQIPMPQAHSLDLEGFVLPIDHLVHQYLLILLPSLDSGIVVTYLKTIILLVFPGIDDQLLVIYG